MLTWITSVWVRIFTKHLWIKKGPLVLHFKTLFCCFISKWQYFKDVIVIINLLWFLINCYSYSFSILWSFKDVSLVVGVLLIIFLCKTTKFTDIYCFTSRGCGVIQIVQCRRWISTEFVTADYITFITAITVHAMESRFELMIYLWAWRQVVLLFRPILISSLFVSHFF